MLHRTLRTRARAAMGAAGALAVAGVALVWLLVPATPALAYVDPSVMTYTIQALAAVAVALSAVIGVAFRRTRKALMRLLHVEEHREAEPQVHRIDPSQKAAADARALAARREAGEDASRARDRGGEALPWRRRIAPAALVAAFVVFTLMVVAPYELIAGNADSLVFGLAQTWSVFVLPAVVCWAALALVISAFRGRAFDVVLMLAFGFGLASYAQALFLNGGLPSATGATVQWNDLTKLALARTLVWLVVLLAPLLAVALSHRRRRMRSVAAIASVALVLVQAVGVGSLFVGSAPADASPSDASDSADVVYTLTEKGLLTVSPKSNVIVFVLDMGDSNLDMATTAQEHPEALAELTGFTWYQNTTGVITPTRDAIPSILTGHAPGHESYSEYTNERWKRGRYLYELTDAGYDVGLYTDWGYQVKGEPYVSDNAMNAVPADELGKDAGGDATELLDVRGTLKELYQCAAYRDLPWVMKPFFWYYTDDINQAMVAKTPSGGAGAGNSDVGASTPYTIDDARLASELRGVGLRADDDAKTGAFRFIHLNGPHWPYTLDENGVRQSSTTREQQFLGSLGIVSEYLRQLKELGLYDDATILIISDHGDMWGQEPIALTDAVSNPLFLVKPPQDHEAASQPYAVSRQPVSNLDALPTALAAAGVADDGSGDGENVIGLDDPGRVRIFDQLNRSSDGVEAGVVEYEITGDANQLENWHYTGWVMVYPEGQWQRWDPATDVWHGRGDS